VSESIKFLNKKAKKEAFKRGLDVLAEVIALKRYDYGVMRETRDIARFEFLAGVQRYLIGFFDDSIYHSTLSVELGLLIRLEETITEKEKSEIHERINSKDGLPFSFTFGAIFDETKKRNRSIIKDGQVLQRIAKIIETRNTHIHAGNFTSASILSTKEIIPKIEEGLRNMQMVEKNRIVKTLMKKSLPKMKTLLNETCSTIDSLPSFEWCTKDRQRTQTQNHVSNHFSEQFTVIDVIEGKHSITEKVQLGLNATKIIRDLKEDTYSKRKALETIQDSFEVLKGINIFEEG